MNIRYAKESDIDQLIELCEAHAIYEKASYNKDGKAELLLNCLFHQKDVLECLVVADGLELVGYATFMKQFSTWDAEYYLYLDCLFLTESSRGKGIGEAMMRQIYEIAVQKEYSRVEWQTPDFNDGAIRFYNKIGALSKSKERFYWKCINFSF